MSIDSCVALTLKWPCVKCYLVCGMEKHHFSNWHRLVAILVLDPCGMWSTPSLPLFPHRPEVVVSVRDPSMGQIELLVLNSNTWNHLTVQIELLVLHSNSWMHFILCKQEITILENNLTESRQMTNIKRNYFCWVTTIDTIELCANKWVLSRLKMLLTKRSLINMIYIYKQDLALNNPLGLICHKTQPKQTKPSLYYTD